MQFSGSPLAGGNIKQSLQCTQLIPNREATQEQQTRLFGNLANM